VVPRPDVLALDFDGVLSDGMREYLTSRTTSSDGRPRRPHAADPGWTPGAGTGTAAGPGGRGDGQGRSAGRAL